MLRHTFLHIPGIGAVTERRLWSRGCGCWEELLGRLDELSCGTAEVPTVRRFLNDSIRALKEGEHQFFARRLRRSEAWRAWADFRHSCAYLDIETDGGASSDSITVIGIYDGQEYRSFVQGENLESFRDAISRYSMVVTFFGHGFDIPVLKRRFGEAAFDQIHIDLCPTLRRLEYRGGLKRIEKEVGIRRSPETEGLDGYDAVRLWRRYRWRRDERALERLIAYNREDVVNLERLAALAYERLKREVFVLQPALV